MIEQPHLRPLGLLLGPLLAALAAPALAQPTTEPAPAPNAEKVKRVRGPGYFVQLPVTQQLRAYATRVGKGVDYTETKVEHRRYPRQVFPDDGLVGIPDGYDDRFSAESIYVGFGKFAVERLKFESRQVALDWAAALTLGTRGNAVWRLVEVRGRHVVHVAGGRALDRSATLLAARKHGWSGFKVSGEPDLLRVSRGEAMAISVRNDGGLLRACLNDVLVAVQSSLQAKVTTFPAGDSPIVGAKQVRILSANTAGTTIRAQLDPVGVRLEVQRDDQLLRCRVGRPADLEPVMRAFKRLAPKGLKRKVAFPGPSSKKIPAAPVPIEQATGRCYEANCRSCSKK